KSGAERRPATVGSSAVPGGNPRCAGPLAPKAPPAEPFLDAELRGSMSNDWIKRLRHESDAFMNGVFNIYAIWETDWWRQAEKDIAMASPSSARRKRNLTQEEIDEEECRYRRPPRGYVARSRSNGGEPPSIPGESTSPAPGAENAIDGKDTGAHQD